MQGLQRGSVEYDLVLAAVGASARAWKSDLGPIKLHESWHPKLKNEPDWPLQHETKYLKFCCGGQQGRPSFRFPLGRPPASLVYLACQPCVLPSVLWRDSGGRLQGALPGPDP